MIQVEIKAFKRQNIENGQVVIQGSPEKIYNEMILLLKNIRDDNRLQRIFIDASEAVLSNSVNTTSWEEKSNE